jgi:hypothetical protein
VVLLFLEEYIKSTDVILFFMDELGHPSVSDLILCDAKRISDRIGLLDAVYAMLP